ncbi:MAG: HDOD domain-containing protein [Psychrobium sp.]|nr:HDOD domain-containing protein [Psychrobium sp.]
MSRIKNWLSKDKTLETSDERQLARPVVKKRSGLKPHAIQIVESDFYRFLVSKASLLPQEVDDVAEIPDDRILLEVELAPTLLRQALKQESKDLFEALKAQLFQDVESRVEYCLADLKEDTLQRFAISSSSMEAVNLLSTKVASISRIKPFVLKQSNLVQSFVSVLNRFGVGQRQSGKPLETKDAGLALSFLGVEQIRYVIPYLMVNESLKDSGVKYSQSSRKIWNHVQITATAAHALASLDDSLNEDQVYMMAIFHEIGATFLLHVVDDCFHSARRDISKMAASSGASEVSHQLSEIYSAVPVLDKLMPIKARGLSAQLARHYNLNHFMLANTLDELAQTMEFEDLGPYAKVIAQARSYSVFKQMFKEQLIDKKQAAALLNYYQLDTPQIKYLNKQLYLKVPKIEP